MGTELATVGVFAAYASVGASYAHGIAFAVFALPHLVTALVLVRLECWARTSQVTDSGPWPAGLGDFGAEEAEEMELGSSGDLDGG